MKFLAVFALAVAVTSAIPLGGAGAKAVVTVGNGNDQAPKDSGTGCQPSTSSQDNNICPDGLYGVAQCCSVSVLGVADLDCKAGRSPDATP